MQGINGNESQKNLSNNSNFNENILDEVKIYCGNLKIYTVYGFLDKSNYRNQSHLHNSYELHVVISGSANMVVSGREIKISRNSIIIIPPNTEHNFQEKSTDSFYDMVIMFGYKKNVEDSRNGFKLYDQFNNLIHSPYTNFMFKNKTIRETAEKISQLQKNGNVLFYPILNTLIKTIFLYIMQSKQNSKKNIQKENVLEKELPMPENFLIIKRMDEYMNRYCTNVSLAGLAEYIALSKRQTQRIFKNIYGTTFSKKITELRLNKAIKLMKRKELTLFEIATNIGYGEYILFSRAFLNTYGISPSEYRKKIND